MTGSGATAPVSVSIRSRQLLVGAVLPNGASVGPMCYRLTPIDTAFTAPTLNTCTFLVLGVPVAQFVGVWRGIQYRLDVTSNPPDLAPAAGQNGQIVGPFDDTTLVNSVIITM